MKLGEITRMLEQLAPLSLQESYDNAGLLVGNRDDEITGALICLDITEAVLDEALGRGLNMIIAHHPLIFKPLKRLTASNATERIVMESIRKGIAIYAIHTNLDSVLNGVSACLANQLGLINTKVLSPRKGVLRKLVTFCPVSYTDKVRQAMCNVGAGKIGNYDQCSFAVQGQGTFRGLENANPFVGKVNEIHTEEEQRLEVIYPVYKEQQVIDAMRQTHPYEEVAYDIYELENEFSEVGFGMIGDLAQPVREEDFLRFVKTVTASVCLRYTTLTGKAVKRVAVCGGSGSFLIKEALAAGADVFVTGDVKYHEFFDAESRMVIADIGHYESEQFVLELIHAELIEKLPNFANFISGAKTNPIHCLS